VKTTAELLAIRSDAYVLTDEFRVALAPERQGRAPIVELDSAFFGGGRDLDERFPAGPPSLLECDRFEVRGDLVFGPGVVVRGSVCVEHDGPGPRQIPPGSVLEGD
jgi:UTP--glucose-1-phosphate uridylyltransferase